MRMAKHFESFTAFTVKLSDVLMYVLVVRHKAMLSMAFSVDLMAFCLIMFCWTVLRIRRAAEFGLLCLKDLAKHPATSH